MKSQAVPIQYDVLYDDLEKLEWGEWDKYGLSLEVTSQGEAVTIQYDDVLQDNLEQLKWVEWAKYEVLEVKSQQEAVPIQYDVLQDNVHILVLSLRCFGVIDIFDTSIKAEEVFDYIQHQPNKSIGFLTSHQLVEEVTINHNSPLHIACLLGDLDMVKKVCCCDYIDCTNKVGDTPLHIACRLGHEDICEYISGQIVADSSVYFVRFKTLPKLYINGGLNYKDTGKVLVSANLPSLFTENEEKLTPFQVALRFQNYSCMSIVLCLPKFHFILCRKSVALIDLSSEQSLEHVNSGTPGGMIISGQLYNEYLKKCTDVAHDYEQRNYTHIIAYVGYNAQCKNDKGQLPIESLMENYDKIDDAVDLVNNTVKHNACFWHNVIKAVSKKFFSFCYTLKLFKPEIWKHLCHTMDRKGNLLLHLICRYIDDATIVTCFCQCDINTKNVYRHNPLLEAFLNSNYSVCRWLVLKLHQETHYCM